MLNDDPSRVTGDIASMGIIVAALADWLPTVATALSVVWFMIRIYETDTVQKIFGIKKEKPDGAPKD